MFSVKKTSPHDAITAVSLIFGFLDCFLEDGISGAHFHLIED